MRMQIHRSNRWAVVCMHCRIYACVHTAVDLVGTRYELAIVRHTIHTAAVQLCVTHTPRLRTGSRRLHGERTTDHDVLKKL